jgi:uncharacterized membrane protein HdeD (DUF308 family)
MTPTSLIPTTANTRTATTVLIVEGCVLALLGLGALAAPVIAGLTAAIFVGWALIAVGVMGLVAAFRTRPHVHFYWSLASGGVAIAAGLFTLIYPLAGVVVLSLVIAAWLALDGVNSVMIAVHVRKGHRAAAVWPALGALIDFALAAFLLVLTATGAVIAVGVIVGVDLIFGGMAVAGMGLAMRRALAEGHSGTVSVMPS